MVDPRIGDMTNRCCVCWHVPCNCEFDAPAKADPQSVAMTAKLWRYRVDSIPWVGDEAIDGR